MPRHLEILGSAITDAGYWRWWTADLPESVQLEFGGTQLWAPPEAPGKPPSGLIALRLVRPSVALFLADGERGLPPDWFERLRRDEGDPFNVERDRFTLTSHDEALGLLDAAATTHALVGSVETARERTAGAVLAFWAHGAGFVGMGDALEVFNFQGQLSPEDIEQAHEKWWEYWKEYWRRIDGPDRLPEDYACEVTIPAGDDDAE